MNIFNKLFKRNKGKLATDSKAGNSSGVRKQLYEAQVVEKIYGSLLSLPDPDAILKKAGLSRQALKKMEGDDEIYTAISKRRGKLLGTPWHLEKHESMDDEALEFIESALTPVMNAILKDSWNALLYGYSVIEAVYKQQEDGKIIFSDVTKKPFDWFRVNPNTLELRYFAPDGSGGSDGVVCDPNFKFFLTRHEADYENPHGVALLSKLYWPWIFRHEGWRYYMQWLERFGIPTITVKTEQNNVDERNKLAESLAESVQDSVIVVGSSDDVELVEVKGKGEPFTSMENMLSKRILKTILGATLNTDVQDKGSRAASETHRDELTDKRDADSRMIIPTVQAMVAAITELNYPGQIAPEFVMEENKGLQDQRAERDERLSKTGVKFSKKYFVETYDFEEDDIEVIESTNQDDDGQEDNPDDPKKDNTKDNIPANDPKADKDKPKDKPKKEAASLEDMLAIMAKSTSIQEAVDSVADAIYRQTPDPIDPAVIYNTIRLSKDADDLQARLEKLIDNVDLTFHQETLQRAFFQTNVLGYVDSEGKV